MLFGEDGWWFKKEACDKFKNEATFAVICISLPFGSSMGAPVRIIDQTYVV